MQQSCPCNSDKPYAKCCEPFHKGKSPQTAEELMRSRYSAYALGLSRYIIRTTHPASPQYKSNAAHWEKQIDEFCSQTQFKKLEVLQVQETEPIATVVFIAHLSQNGKDLSFQEKSYFEKVKGQWLYRNGQLAEGHTPNLLTAEQARVLPLAYYGHPVLRKKAEPVAEITDEIRKLAQDMIETMDAYDGLGLAAPQVHYSLRMFVTRKPTEQADGLMQLGEAKVFINPKLSSPSEKTWTESEGCLSIPTIHAKVKRPKEITVEYLNLEGQTVTERVSGWEAKCIMHETDHINGTLFIDRLTEEEKKRLEPVLKALHHRIYDGREM